MNDLENKKESKIKLIGIGGAGCNTLRELLNLKILDVDLIICSTSIEEIKQSPILNKIQLGPLSTNGLGAGANPEIGKIATEESMQELKRILNVNTSMVFITAGMGGGTGTGGTPVVAKICKELGIISVGVVTLPFAFEGPRRKQQAKDGIKELKKYVDTLIVISNDRLRIRFGNLKMKEAFGKSDIILANAIKCFTDIINSKGHILVDFTDICNIIKDGSLGLIGYAIATGENRASLAIEEAYSSHLLVSYRIKNNAKRILININSSEGDNECTMDELDYINEYIKNKVGECEIVLGMCTDNSLKEKLSINIVVTGIEYEHFDIEYEEKLLESKISEINPGGSERNNVNQFFELTLGEQFERSSGEVLQKEQECIDEKGKRNNRKKNSIFYIDFNKLYFNMKTNVLYKRCIQAIVMPIVVLMIQLLFKFLLDKEITSIGVSLGAIALGQIFPYLFFDNLIMLKVFSMSAQFENIENKLINSYEFKIKKDSNGINTLKNNTVMCFLLILFFFLASLTFANKTDYYSYHYWAGAFAVTLSSSYVIFA